MATAERASRFRSAIDAIDAANAEDPTTLATDGSRRPKELVHAEMLTRWVELLVPNPSEPLRLAARAHHIERWRHPRSEYPEGRRGYLRWRTALHAFHAARARDILAAAGYDEATISRVETLITKKTLGRDPEAQVIEDGLCLVFLETQFAELAGRLDREKMVDILRKSWRKMSTAGQEEALKLAIPEPERAIIRDALADQASTQRPAIDD